MKRYFLAVVSVFFLISMFNIYAADVSSNKISEVIYTINFEQSSTENARSWLTGDGFNFESGATSQSNLDLYFANNSLVMNTTAEIFGLIIKNVKIEGAKEVRITWGVNSFPKGASYNTGVNNEPIMVYIYYGDKKLSSDSWFIPNAPYFIGLFLGEKGANDVNKPFIGEHFTQGGRFICLANPNANETVTSTFDLNKGFNECFGKNLTVPYISGVALEVETSDTSPAKSFIKKIEFLR